MRPSARRSLSLSLSLCLRSSSLLCLKQSCLLLMCWFEIDWLPLTQLIVPWQMWKNTEGKFAITTYTNLSVESWTCEQNLSVLKSKIKAKEEDTLHSTFQPPRAPEAPYMTVLTKMWLVWSQVGALVHVQLYTFSYRKPVIRPQNMPKTADWG